MIIIYIILGIIFFTFFISKLHEIKDEIELHDKDGLDKAIKEFEEKRGINPLIDP